jgi:type I restriction enzyme R subunit
LKTETFVLDFRNDGEAIVKEFEKYYGRTVAPTTDPNLLWDTRALLDDYDVLRIDEVEATVALLLAITGAKDHGHVYALLDPAVERFRALGEEERLGFKDTLDRFVRTYAFLSQVVSFGDTKLERDYLYCRALASRLRDERTSTSLDLGSEIELTHLRSEVTFQGSLSLNADTAEIKTIFGEGRGPQHEPDREPLSQIVDELNERFGLKLDERDQILFDQFEQTWLADPEVSAQAKNNTFNNFRLVFDRLFLGTLIGRMDDNETIVRRVLDDEDFQTALKDLYATRIYRRARSASPGGS